MPVQIPSPRFDTEQGYEISVQVPLSHAEPLLAVIQHSCPLRYGPYDKVSFQSALGLQRFRALPGGRNAVTKGVVAVPCVELSFFVANTEDLPRVVEAIYDQHPYEEPVIFVRDSLRTLHRTGTDEDNPNKFWNRAAEDWIPDEHLPKASDF